MQAQEWTTVRYSHRRKDRVFNRQARLDLEEGGRGRADRETGGRTVHSLSPRDGEGRVLPYFLTQTQIHSPWQVTIQVHISHSHPAALHVHKERSVPLHTSTRTWATAIIGDNQNAACNIRRWPSSSVFKRIHSQYEQPSYTYRCCCGLSIYS